MILLLLLFYRVVTNYFAVYIGCDILNNSWKPTLSRTLNVLPKQ
jgi:hypothetical protein